MKPIIKHLATSLIAMLLSWCVYAQPNITRVEYYIDADPGYGNATALSITPGTNLVNLTINLNPATLSNGVHVLGVRARDANGAWSHDNRWLFAKPYASDTATPGPLPAITRVEYYIDSDPGYGNATALSITPGTNLANLAINLNPATLSNGVHVLGVRARDANGTWSHDNRWLFARPYASDTTTPGPVPNLRRIEYYIDTDPGYGNGIPVAQENVGNINNLGLSVNISGLAAGSHTLYIRSSDANNAWSLDNKWDFTVGTPISAASIIVNSVSKKTMCAGETLNVGYDARGTFNSGNTFTVQLSNSSGSFTSPTVIGTRNSRALNGVISCTLPASLSTGTGYKVRLVSSNTVVTGTASEQSLTINALPPLPTITAGGPTTFCQGGSVTLTASAASSYLWSNGATTQSITVNNSGNYTVTVANASGCRSISSPVNVTVNPVPTATITAGGPTTFCQGGTVTLTASAASSYLWSNGATTQSITVSTSGNYTVAVTNAIGCSSTSAATAVNVVANPTPTITASGSTTNVCPGRTVTLDAGAGYTTYLWSTGATTRTIVVSAAGSYSVTVTNATGCSGTSAPTVVTYQGCPKPTNPVNSNITATSARLSWTPPASCAIGYQLQYRQVSTTSWTTLQFANSSRNITGLLPNTTYEWRVQTGCQQTPPIGSGNISGPNFTTLSAAIAGAGMKQSTGGGLKAILFPNPARDVATIQLSGITGAVTIRVTDMAGKTVWQSPASTARQLQVPVAQLSSGTYLVTVIGAAESTVLKLVKE